MHGKPHFCFSCFSIVRSAFPITPIVFTPSLSATTQLHIHARPVAPVAYQVILEPGIGQFREFEPRRVHTRINSWGLFLLHKLTCGKRESVS